MFDDFINFSVELKVTFVQSIVKFYIYSVFKSVVFKNKGSGSIIE